MNGRSERIELRCEDNYSAACRVMDALLREERIARWRRWVIDALLIGGLLTLVTVIIEGFGRGL